MKWLYQQSGIILTLALILVSLAALHPTLGSQSPNSENTIAQTPVRFVPPQLPDRGAPSGRRKGAASRSGCPIINTDKPLIALVPGNNLGLTVSNYPTFWFHVPALPENARSAEFILQDSSESDIYKTSFTLPETSGIIKVSLPSIQPISLKIGERYRWYFKIYCLPKNTYLYFFVEGQIERVPENAYAANSIWYDLLTNLAARRRTAPENANLREDWTNLLKEVGLEKLVEEPLLSCCTPDNSQ
ncbi:DUF928 domain-containing protein [Microseira wollei]|uniref:DUF928 domain-containing protein n=1 Tax=Microseira wollei NIES-4236 TaxID=2530354 RepID=A0AAV3XIJ3_9CYAN|nr:DUF928 domain-containing protein [Microseira wollei]GET39970.1 hypothetical protein MiSe_47430 [Microseira wollei NIES-4236]